MQGRVMTFPPASLPIPRSPEFDELAAGAQFRDLIAVRVAAEPEALFRALREVTLADMPLARLVGGIRYLPTRLAGRHPQAVSIGDHRRRNARAPRPDASRDHHRVRRPSASHRRSGASAVFEPEC